MELFRVPPYTCTYDGSRVTFHAFTADGQPIGLNMSAEALLDIAAHIKESDRKFHEEKEKQDARFPKNVKD